MRPWRCPPPTYALHEAPALAAVDAAGIVLWLVVGALRAAHPELRDGDPDPRSRTTVWLAQAVIALTEHLRVAMICYREAAHDETLTTLPTDDDDLPF
jgi:hypothetical protein